MSYTPTTWHGGDVLSAEAMNKIENGIAGAGSGALEINVEEDENELVMDKTWQEIWDAFPNVYANINFDSSVGKGIISSVANYSGDYLVTFNNIDFFTNDPNNYPYALTNNGGYDDIS